MKTTTSEPADMADIDLGGARPSRFNLWVGVGLALAALLISAGALYLLARDRPPAEASADVGFARDMSRHHAQAVEMATIAFRRTEDEEIAILASDILTTQQFQIGMMTGWLDIWDKTVTGSEPSMAWTGDMSMEMPDSKDPAGATDLTHADGEMPGLATPEEMALLAELPPAEMDQEFLRLMIRHHQGGVLMAEAALDLANEPQVKNFSEQIIASQSAEINTMQDMLDARTA